MNHTCPKTIDNNNQSELADDDDDDDDDYPQHTVTK